MIALSAGFNKPRKESANCNKCHEFDAVKKFFGEHEIREMGVNADKVFEQCAKDPQIRVNLDFSSKTG